MRPLPFARLVFALSSVVLLPSAIVAQVPETYERVAISANRSRVLSVPFDVTRIAVTNPAVADAVVVTPREVLIDGKGAGTTSLIVWGAGTRVQYDIAVDPGVTALEQHFKALFPGEDIRVSVSEGAVILAGEVSSQKVVLRAGEIAGGVYAKSTIINLLSLPGGTPSQQVQLQVRIAEVNRTAMKELGASFFSTGSLAARTSTQQFSAPLLDDTKNEGLLFSDFLNLFLFDRKNDIGVLIKALEKKGNYQSLAEPNLVAYNGQDASFLAGGEFPIPLVTGTGNMAQVTVVFKEFGVRLNFKPTIAGDTIRLHVRPEVSTLDFTNGVDLQGFRIPALSTRRAETDVELRDGQSFAIAGLMSNLAQYTNQEIPWLSKIPIIGNFFKSKADRTEQTELLVLITPRLVTPLDPDDVPAMPVDPTRFMPVGPTADGKPSVRP